MRALVTALGLLASGLLGCAIVAQLGEDPPPRSELGDGAADVASDVATDVGDAPGEAEVTPPTEPNLLAYVAGTGRALFLRLSPTGVLDVSTPVDLDVGLTHLVELTPDRLVGFQSSTGKFLTLELDRASRTIVSTKARTVVGYQHVAALTNDTVMFYRSDGSTAHYRVDHLDAATWSTVLEKDDSTSQFQGLDRFARTRTNKLMFRTSTAGNGRLCEWTGTKLEGPWVAGGSAGWDHIVPMAGPALFYFSTQIGSPVVATGALERIYPDNTNSVVVYWAAKDFPWKTSTWTDVVGTTQLLLFYRRTDGRLQAIRPTVDEALVLRPDPVDVTGTPGPGVTHWVSLE